MSRRDKAKEAATELRRLYPRETMGEKTNALMQSIFDYLDEAPGPHPDDALRREVHGLLLMLDAIRGCSHWLIGSGDEAWRIVCGLIPHRYKLLDGPDAPFRTLLETRDNLREMVSPPTPDEPQAVDEPESEVVKLKRRIEALEKAIANWNERLAAQNYVIVKQGEAITELRKTSVPKTALREPIDHEAKQPT